jgi:exoribonuclease-2
MIGENTLVIYKGKPALVKEKLDGKYSISLPDGSQVRVRDKDIELLHPGPVKSLAAIGEGSPSESIVREAWELLSDEGSQQELKELAVFIFNEYTPSSAYAVYCLLRDGLYFTGTIYAIKPRNRNEVAAEETKRGEKERETGERTQFLERIKKCIKRPEDNPMLPDDVRFIQDIEALAYGKTVKSRTMKDLGLGETPEEAHFLLLKTGFWNGMVNPYPSRFGIALSGAVNCPEPPSTEDRQDLCHMAAFAIDNSWSNDPDDAISLAYENGECFLYVHVADPAATITFDSPAEKEARDRGATLYLPEGVIRMMADESLSLFALGLSEKSPALTFKMKIDESGEVIDTDIFPSMVKVRRLTYEEADMEMENTAVLRSIYDLTQKIYKRRIMYGAVSIDLPDVYISVTDGIIKIKPEKSYRSASLVRECMVAAGEGAGTWAASRGLAFPYISQEVELQGKILGGYAGSMQLRKSMRPRVLSTKPGRHQGLGLDTYSQVSSPLRRYTDLLAHIQIRTILRGEKPLGVDDVSAHLGFSEAAAIATVQAERASNNHWIMVYLSGKKDSIWDAVALENKGSRWSVIIPSLSLETQVALQRDVLPNDDVKLVLKSVNIAKGDAVFLQVIDG